jgi:hypothetical protein
LLFFSRNEKKQEAKLIEGTKHVAKALAAKLRY